MRKTCLALAIVLALPALLHAQEAEEPEKKEKRAQFIIHANYLPTLPNLDETTSFTRFLEQGSTSRVYSGGSGTAIEVGGMYALASRFAFGFSFELLPALQDGTLDVSEPHPLLFNQHLKASQTLDELDYSEFTVHTAFAYRIASERIEVELFAGPSVFTTEIELIDKVVPKSEYPFDEISLTGVSSVTLNNTAIGFNAGAGLAYYFTETWGASFLVRFSQADIEVQREGGEPLGFKAGGLRFGGGIRIRF